MEIKNGIVINGVLHKLVSIHSDEPCSNCSLQEKCERGGDLYLCTIITGQYNRDDYFINCGKVTDNFVYDDNAKEEEE
jgi:hypothetical protein